MSFLGGAQERLSFVLQLDDRGAVRAFGQLRASASRDLGEVDGRLDRLGGRMQAGGAAAVGFSLVAGRALASFASASEEAEAQHRKLDLALANSPQLAGETAGVFEDLAEHLQDTTTAEGDAVIGLEGFLGTLGRTRDEILTLTPLVVDLATRYGLDFEAAGRLVNNAAEGNTARLERLIGTMQTGESVADALARTVGGFAEGEAQSLSGRLEILKNNLGDVTEGLGVGVVSAVNTVVGPLSGLVDNVSEVNPGLLEMVGRVGAIGTAGLGAVGGLSLLAGTVMKMGDRFTTTVGEGAEAVTSLNNFGRAAAIVGGAAGVGALIVGLYELSEATTGAQVDLEEFASSTDADFAKTVDRLGVLFTRASDVTDDAIDQMLRASVPATERFADAMDEAGLSSDYLRQRIEEKRAADVRASADQETYSAAVAEGTDELDDNSGATERNTTATHEATDAYNRAREATEQRTQAMNDLLDATLAQFDAELAHRQAERDTAQAYSELNVAIDQNGRDSQEAAVAADEAAQAALRQAEAAADLAVEAYNLDGATNEATVRQQVMRGELQNIADSLAPNSPLRAQLQQYIDSLNQLDGRQVEVEILASYGLKGSGTPLLLSKTPRAFGGNTWMGGQFSVAEDGSEVYVDAHGNKTLIPGADGGRVVPNDRLSAVATSSTIVNVNVDRTHVDERRLGDRIGRDIAWAMR